MMFRHIRGARHTSKTAGRPLHTDPQHADAQHDARRTRRSAGAEHTPHGLEPLEPRLLLSASMSLAGLADVDDERDTGGQAAVHDVAASPPLQQDAIATAVDAAAPAPFPTSQTFELHSNAGADHTIYLDFDGHTTSGTRWNTEENDGNNFTTPAYDHAGDGATFSSADHTEIQHIWQRVAEDFIPFDVDVTTEDPGVEALRKSNGSDQQWGVRVVIGGSSTQWYESSGGVAYIGSFDSDIDVPCYVFSGSNSTSEGFVAEAASHEAGHTLGLHHDGQEPGDGTYYEGHGSGETAWAPIMGNSYFESITQWSQGEYHNANETEDDLSIITKSANGFGFRADDHSDGLGFNDPTPLTVSGGTNVSGEGIISRNDDLDNFKFDHGGGTIDLTFNNFERGPNLDIAVAFYQWDSGSGTWSLLTQAEPDADTDAAISGTYPVGTYMVSIDGDGFGDPESSSPTGYTDYASLGQYTISGTVSGSPEPDRFEDNDTFATATDLGVGDRTENNLTIDEAGDDDFYEWTSPGDGLLVAATMFDHSEGDLGMVLYDSSQNPLDSSGTNTDNEHVTATVTGGQTYYIQVFGDLGAIQPDYDLGIDGPEDDHGNDAGSATAVSVPSSTNGDLEVAGDADWFSFDATWNATYNIDVNLDTLNDSYLRLYGTDGTTKIDENDDSGGTFASSLQWTAPASGTYYFSVRDYLDNDTGTYTVDIDYQDDHGNQPATATSVSAGSTTPGELEVGYDDDWFSFTAQQDSTYQFQAVHDTLTDTKLRLIDTDGTTELLADTSSPGDAGSTLAWVAPSDGTYYLHVGGSIDDDVTGTYDLTVEETEPEAEIVVTGNGQNITDGDSTPSAADGTTFGSVEQDATAPQRTYTVQNTGSEDLGLATPTLPAGFTIVESLDPIIAPAASDSFTVELDTSLLGENTGDISIANTNPDENPFNFAISGTVYLPATIKGQVFADYDNDATWDPNEHGVDGDTVDLQLLLPGTSKPPVTTHAIDLDGNGTIDPRTDRGWYEFTGLEPGMYEVVATSLVGSLSAPANATGTYQLTVSSGQVLTGNDFGDHFTGPFTVTTADDENDNDYSADDLSLREALYLSSTIPDQQTIDFDPALNGSTITLTDGLGDLVIDSDVIINGPGSGQLTVDADSEGARRPFYVESGVTAEINGLTATGGHLDAPGGGIYNFGDLTLNDVIVRDNAGYEGTGIYNASNATLTFNDSELRNNELPLYSTIGGGGLHNAVDGTATLRDSTVSGNSAIVDGGGIVNLGDLTLENVAINDNGSENAGGLYNTGTASATNVTFMGNSGGPGDGGAIQNDGQMTISGGSFSDNQTFLGASGGAIANTGSLVISDVTVRNNYAAGSGSGMANTGDLTMFNSTVSGNQAPGSFGGGLYVDGGNTTLINVTITENDVDYEDTAAGIHVASGTVTLHNTIVANNVSGFTGAHQDVYGTFDALSSHNLIGAIDGSTDLDGAGTQSGTAASPLDPMLGALGDNGGTTLTHKPTPASPVIDAGNNLVAVDDQGDPLTVDQRGMLRPSDGNYDGITTVDIGAVEALPSVITARKVFYNNSAFDGNDPAANANDDDALAWDKIALRPGETADDLKYYTSYERGLNGIFVDIANAAAPGAIDATDFELKVGNDSSPNDWAVLTAPVDVSVREGAGGHGSDRITLILPDGAVTGEWLQVTVLANGDTGLAQNDVFYFGNAIGEGGDSTTDVLVNATDFVDTRDNQHGIFNQAEITDPYDFNRDKLVNATDMVISRDHQTSPFTMLQLISAPASGGAPTESATSEPVTTQASQPAETSRSQSSQENGDLAQHWRAMLWHMPRAHDGASTFNIRSSGQLLSDVFELADARPMQLHSLLDGRADELSPSRTGSDWINHYARG